MAVNPRRDEFMFAPSNVPLAPNQSAEIGLLRPVPQTHPMRPKQGDASRNELSIDNVDTYEGFLEEDRGHRPEFRSTATAAVLMVAGWNAELGIDTAFADEV